MSTKINLTADDMNKFINNTKLILKGMDLLISPEKRRHIFMNSIEYIAENVDVFLRPENIKLCIELVSKRIDYENIATDDCLKTLKRLDNDLFNRLKRHIIETETFQKTFGELPSIEDDKELSIIYNYANEIRQFEVLECIVYINKKTTTEDIKTKTPITCLYFGVLFYFKAIEQYNEKQQIDKQFFNVMTYCAMMLIANAFKRDPSLKKYFPNNFLIESFKSGMDLETLDVNYYNDYIKIVKRYVEMMEAFGDESPHYSKFFVNIPQNNPIIEEFERQIEENESVIEDDNIILPLVNSILVDPNEHREAYCQIETFLFNLITIADDMEKEYNLLPEIGSLYFEHKNSFINLQKQQMI